VQTRRSLSAEQQALLSPDLGAAGVSHHGHGCCNRGSQPEKIAAGELQVAGKLVQRIQSERRRCSLLVHTL